MGFWDWFFAAYAVIGASVGGFFLGQDDYAYPYWDRRRVNLTAQSVFLGVIWPVVMVGVVVTSVLDALADVDDPEEVRSISNAVREGLAQR